MCGSGRLETSCHSGAMMAGMHKIGRGRFAEKTVKLHTWRIVLSSRGTVLRMPIALLKSAHARRRAWTTDALHYDDGSPGACGAGGSAARPIPKYPGEHGYTEQVVVSRA